MVGGMKASKKSVAGVSDYQLLLKPVITEKSSMVGGNGNTVVFHVDPRATKEEVKAAVERVFQVEVAKVRTTNYLGKVKRTTGRMGRTVARKKAFVTLKEGFSINVVEGL